MSADAYHITAPDPNGAGAALAMRSLLNDAGIAPDEVCRALSISEDNLFVRTQNGVRFSLVGGLVSTAQLEIDYDRTPAPGRRQTDRSFAITFGYRF